uniref:Uncharacterized protein n=1 Tax=Mycena chlorophos TaxID=658473 RepID=A0ABQ0L4F7_MYCCL|nr:predicted protein [Mycena chlorophos]
MARTTPRFRLELHYPQTLLWEDCGAFVVASSPLTDPTVWASADVNAVPETRLVVQETTNAKDLVALRRPFVYEQHEPVLGTGQRSEETRLRREHPQKEPTLVSMAPTKCVCKSRRPSVARLRVFWHRGGRIGWRWSREARRFGAGVEMLRSGTKKTRKTLLETGATSKSSSPSTAHYQSRTTEQYYRHCSTIHLLDLHAPIVPVYNEHDHRAVQAAAGPPRRVGPRFPKRTSQQPTTAAPASFVARVADRTVPLSGPLRTRTKNGDEDKLGTTRPRCEDKSVALGRRTLTLRILLGWRTDDVHEREKCKKLSVQVQTP